jgi:hypothetical protein
VGTRDREAVEDEQDVKVAQGQLAVEVEQGEADPAERGAEQRAGFGGDGWQWGLVRPGWPSGPAGGHLGPEPVVHGQRLLVGGLLARHPVNSLAVELVQRVDGFCLLPSSTCRSIQRRPMAMRAHA